MLATNAKADDQTEILLRLRIFARFMIFSESLRLKEKRNREKEKEFLEKKSSKMMQLKLRNYI